MLSREERNSSLVVIDVELCIGVRSTRCFEGDAHVVFTNDIVEVAVTEGTILVENFVHDVLEQVNNVALQIRSVETTYPGIDFALVTGHHRGDVVLHDTDESVLVRDGRHP